MSVEALLQVVAGDLSGSATAAVVAVPEVEHVPSLSPSRAADFKTCRSATGSGSSTGCPSPRAPPRSAAPWCTPCSSRCSTFPAADRTLGAAQDMVAGAWADLREAEPELGALFEGAAADEEQTWLASARALLESYFALEDPTRLEPAGREERVEVEVGGSLVLRGIIDRLDANAAGALRVVDYKTGAAPSEAWESKALFQLKFYALVIWRTRGVVPAVLQLLYLADRKRLTYSPTEAELVAMERHLLALGEAVEHARATGDFRAHKGPLCGWCDHQALCPEFGGTPPPYPLLPVV